MSLVLLLIGLMPASRVKNFLLRLSGRGWSIDRTATIHPILLWRVGCLRLAEHTYIGPGTVFRDLARVTLGAHVGIGQFNWFSAAASGLADWDESVRASLLMAPHSSVTSRHYVDCSGGVLIGKAALVAGVRSTILSHSLNPHTYVQEARPVRIGTSSVVFTNAVITAGTTIAGDCLVAAGAVVVADLTVPGRMYGGVPAIEIADTSTSAYVGRETTRATARRPILARARPSST